MTRALLLALLLSGCGSPTLGGACKVTCDCPSLNAPLKCVGEWGCNTQGTCEYTCKSLCGTGGVFTCGIADDCNGSFCSARKGCK